MTYVVLGLSVLIGLGLMGRWLLNANPGAILRVAKWVALATVVGLGVYILFRGRLDYVIYAVSALVPFLVRWGGVLRAIRNAAKAASGPTPGQSSEVRTRYLLMTLDHDTGAMGGRVIAGRFAGAPLDALSREDLADLYAEVSDDAQSLQVLEAWIERARGEDWREADRGDGGRRGAGAGGRGGGEPEMTRAYALALLGLEEGASEDEIRKAHKRLMMANHPDRGGSSIIAAQINRAKDFLLRDA